jgi:hypothetical protein
MLELSPQVLTILSLVGLGLAVLAVFLLLATAPGKRKSRLSQSRDAVEVLDEQGQAIVKLRRTVRQLAEEQQRHAELLLSSVQRVGLVRYDAFEDMGGHLSFSAALLDERGNGLVITSINGRQDTRCYAKPVRGGASAHNLSVEEQEAIGQALSGEFGQVHPPVQAAADGRPGRIRSST